MVVWIIGLSGAGKTTLAKRVVSGVRVRGRTVVLLDGDEIRDVFGNDLTHDLKGRFQNAQRICRLCALLESQGVDVVCAILSIFPESREWCRRNLQNYYEVFIDTPLDVLQKRDPKGIYRKYERGEISDVAGLDLDFVPPKDPDLLITNNGLEDALLQRAESIIDHICRPSH